MKRNRFLSKFQHFEPIQYREYTLHAFTHIELFLLPLSHTIDILQGRPELKQRILQQLSNDSIGLRAITATFQQNVRIIRHFFTF